jgi:hypothetical protein
MYFSPPSCHFIPLRSKYSPQHPVLKHPQSPFFSYLIWGPSFTPIQSRTSTNQNRILPTLNYWFSRTLMVFLSREMLPWIVCTLLQNPYRSSLFIMIFPFHYTFHNLCSLSSVAKNVIINWFPCISTLSNSRAS